MYIYTSCASDELANDAGEGKGGLWTNKFLAMGNMDPLSEEMVAYDYKGDKIT